MSDLTFSTHSTDSSTSYSLLRRVKRNDADAWQRLIVRSKIANLFEKKNKAPHAASGTEALRRLEQLPDAPDDDETSVVNSLYQRAMRLIEDKFEPRTWQAFMFVVMDGLDTETAGERLGMTPAAVRNARYKVLRELRMQLGDLE